MLIILMDDVGFGQASDVRRRSQYADAEPARRSGHQLQHLSHHLDLLADARGAADRAQPSAGRQWHHRRTRGGLGRLYRRHPEDIGDDGRSPARLRLQDRGDRQVAQHAGRSDHLDGPVRSLADRARLRLFLRLSRRRDVAVGAAAGREHQPDRTAARREIPPHRRSRPARHRLAAAPSGVRSRQAVLPVLGAGRRTRSAPDLQGMGRQVQRQVRRRLGCLSRARLRAPEDNWAGSRPIPSSRRAPNRCPAGTAFPKRSARSSAG